MAMNGFHLCGDMCNHTTTQTVQSRFIQWLTIQEAQRTCFKHHFVFVYYISTTSVRTRKSKVKNTAKSPVVPINTSAIPGNFLHETWTETEVSMSSYLHILLHSHHTILTVEKLHDFKSINVLILEPPPHTTTVLRPFFRDHPGEPVPENVWTLWCKGRLTKADTQTIQLGATPSGLISVHLHHPPFFTG